jgi:hypothetical protein
MKNTVFVSTYHNNPHFIELQAKSFKKFVEDDYDFAVLDDSEDNTRAILSGGLSRPEIISECAKHGVRHISVPQSIHAYYSKGGYVPDENPTTEHPTERHQALIRWLFRNYRSMGLDQYKTLALFDADAFFKKNVNMSNYMTHDIIGTWREQNIVLPLGKFPDNLFPEKVRKLSGVNIEFFTLCMMFINLEHVTNLETMDIGSWPWTDTGSKTYFFMKDNSQYSYAYLYDKHNPEYRIDLLSKNKEANENDAEIIHYRGGSNWSYESPEYCRAKLNKTLQKYLPEFVTNVSEAFGEVRSKDGQHILKK